MNECFLERMDNYGIDSKPKSRGMNARANRRKDNLDHRNDSKEVNDGFDDNDASDLNIRVKDRTGDDVLTSGRKGRIGGLFKEAPIKGLKEGAAEALKRPLTGIFRRPGSRSGRKQEDFGLVSSSGQGGGFLDERSLSPEPAGSSRARGTTSPSEFDSVAKAPLLTASQLHGMLQIDAFASKYPHLAKIDDIDISLLSRYLYTEEEVQDEDVPWTIDYLLASLSSEMREECAQEESEDS
ncbi:hypothetical protein RB195_018059 [Necator americanus]|uniref:Intraflagellar transport protein 43 homolog n=1 Tax=Necator americanus TaxID=51031 RepID=A0ABR1CAX5_NECAM